TDINRAIERLLKIIKSSRYVYVRDRASEILDDPFTHEMLDDMVRKKGDHILASRTLAMFTGIRATASPGGCWITSLKVTAFPTRSATHPALNWDIHGRSVMSKYIHGNQKP
ncbi:MAG: hypothetical protein ACYSPJ_06520, partial [Planctomycetota bacterium]